LPLPLKRGGRFRPPPGSDGPASGKLNLRAPQSLPLQLARQVRVDEVSTNVLAVAVPAEGLGKKQIAGRRDASPSQKPPARFTPDKGLFLPNRNRLYPK